MVLLLYIDDFLILSTYKDRIDGFYTSLQEYLNIEDDGYIYKYLGIELDRLPDGLINLMQPYITQSIVKFVPGMYKSSANPTLEFNPPLTKMRGLYW